MAFTAVPPVAVSAPPNVPAPGVVLKMPASPATLLLAVTAVTSLVDEKVIEPEPSVIARIPKAPTLSFTASIKSSVPCPTAISKVTVLVPDAVVTAKDKVSVVAPTTVLSKPVIAKLCPDTAPKSDA